MTRGHRPIDELVLLAKAGDQQALARLVSENDRLIFSTLRCIPYRDCCEEEDLVQVGRIGILRALRAFEPERGIFLLYARDRIRSEVQRWIISTGFPVHVERRDRLFHADTDRTEFHNALASTSLDHRPRKGGPTLGAVLPANDDSPEEHVRQSQIAAAVERLAQQCDPREEALLRGHLLGGLTLDEAGVGFGLSRSRLGQIKQALMDKIERLAHATPGLRELVEEAA